MSRARTFILAAFFVTFFAAVVPWATAQEYEHEYPAGELFIGYQYMRVGGSGGINANGFNTSATHNFNRWIGATGDFSGAYKNVGGANVNSYMYTFGPTFSARSERVTPFVHVLLGGFHLSASAGGFSGSVNGFAMMIGGGLDVKVSDHFAIRTIQPDWVLWRSHGITEKKIARVSTGLLFRF